MTDQKEINLAIRVATEAAKAHNRCAPEGCGGTPLDPCALGDAIDALAEYQHGPRERVLAEWDEGQQRAVSRVPQHLWVARTWADVRRGDVVRMPGQQETAAEVMELADLAWHVNDIPPTQKQGEPDDVYAKRVEAFQCDVQYRPNEHAGEWTARPVTLRPLAAEDPRTRHRTPNVNPDAPVDIQCTRAELDAIELLGGWAHRIGPTAPATAPKPPAVDHA